MSSQDLRRWMTLLENTPRTLYHGTLRRYLPSILQHGLEPRLGEFTRNAYDEVEAAGIELPELVFAADKQGLGKCVSAIIGQMRQLDLPEDEASFFQNAVLLVIRQGGDFMSHKDDDDDGSYWSDHPETVEPGDYYTDDFVSVDHILTGNKLKGFLARHNVRLGDWYETVATKRERLIRLVIRHHPEVPREAVLARIQALPDSEVAGRLRWYERNPPKPQ